MRYTFGEAIAMCRRFADNGSCSRTVVGAVVNEALERLLDFGNWDTIKRRVRLRVCNRCISLPFGAETVLHCDIDGSPAYIHGTPYQFLHSGPGDFAFRSHTGIYKDLQDEGDHWPTMFDIPKSFIDPRDNSTVVTVSDGMPLALFSTSAADVDVPVTIRGLNSRGEEIVEVVKVRKWEDGIEGNVYGAWDTALNPLTTLDFVEITRVSRAVISTGYLSLLAVDVTTGAVYNIAKYHPSQTEAQFRRYLITNTAEGVPSSVLMYMRMRYIPLVDDSDLVPLESIQAVRFAVQALTAEKAGDTDGSDNFLARAGDILLKRDAAKEVSAGTPAIIDSQDRTSMGAVASSQNLLL